MKMRLSAIAVALVTTLGIGSAVAAPMGPTYGPPVDFDFEGTGESAGHTGGRTFTFTNVNLADFAALFWGAGNIGSAMDGAIDSAGEMMAFSSTSGADAFWTGTTQVSTISGILNIETRFRARILSGADNWQSAASAMITEPGYPVVAAVNATTLVLNFLFEARVAGHSGYQAQNALYDSLSTTASGQSRTSFNSGFYYVPLPAPVLFLGGGLAVLGMIGGLGRRRQA